MRETSDKNKRSLVLCAELLLVLNKHWNDINGMTIMNLTARQDIIGKLVTEYCFESSHFTSYFVIVKWSLSVPSLFS